MGLGTEHLSWSSVQHAMDAVDAVVGTPAAVPQPVEAMLFQRCTQGQEGSRKSPVAVRMRVACPKLGLQLAVGEEWMALTPRVPVSPFHTLEAAIRDVSITLQPTGMQLHHSSCLFDGSEETISIEYTRGVPCRGCWVCARARKTCAQALSSS